MRNWKLLWIPLEISLLGNGWLLTMHRADERRAAELVDEVAKSKAFCRAMQQTAYLLHVYCLSEEQDNPALRSKCDALENTTAAAAEFADSLQTR
jgi:hypothetical protein